MSETSGKKCYACGGMVDAEGMAMGGEAESGEHMMAPDDAVNADGESTQLRQTKEADRNAERRFVRAVRGGR